MWLQPIMTIYHLHSFCGSDIQEQRGWALAQGLSEAAIKLSAGLHHPKARLGWWDLLSGRSLPWLASWCWLWVGGPTSSPSGLFPALLECSYNMMTGEEGEVCVCVVCDTEEKETERARAHTRWKLSLL